MFIIPAPLPPNQGTGTTATIKLGNAYDDGSGSGYIHPPKGLAAHVIDDSKTDWTENTEEGTSNQLFVYASTSSNGIMENRSVSAQATANYLVFHASGSLSSSSFFESSLSSHVIKLHFLRSYSSWTYKPKQRTRSALLPLLPRVRPGGPYGTGAIVGYVPCRFVDLDISTGSDYTHTSSAVSAELQAALSEVTWGGSVQAKFKKAMDEVDNKNVVSVQMSYSGNKGPIFKALDKNADPMTWFDAVESELNDQDEAVKQASTKLSIALIGDITSNGKRFSSVVIPPIITTNTGIKVPLEYLYAPYSELLDHGDKGAKIDEQALNDLSGQFLQIDHYVSVLDTILTSPLYSWIKDDVRKDLKERLGKESNRKKELLAGLKMLLKGKSYELSDYELEPFVIPEPYMQAFQLSNDHNGWILKVVLKDGNYTSLSLMHHYYLMNVPGPLIAYDDQIEIDLDNLNNNSPRIINSHKDTKTGDITLQIRVAPSQVFLITHTEPGYPHPETTRSYVVLKLYSRDPDPEHFIKSIHVNASQ